jgi:hypothetical protein
MCAGRPAALSRSPDRFSGTHLVAFPDEGGREMRVSGSRPVLVFDDDAGAVSALVAAKHHFSGASGLNFLSVSRAQVHTLVELHPVGERVAPPAKGRRHLSIHWTHDVCRGVVHIREIGD